VDVELLEIQDFLASHPPFDKLPAETLERLPKRLSVRYLRRGNVFPPTDADQPYLYIVRRGAVEIRNGQGDLIGKLAEGDLYHAACSSQEELSLMQCSTAEDTLFYLLPCSDLTALREAHAIFAEHFDQSVAQRLRRALDAVINAPTSSAGLMTLRVGKLINRALVTATPETSIREAAQIMSENKVSSLLIMVEDRLAGLITDRDLRSRCVAAGLPTDRPVREIVTEHLKTVTADTVGFEALLTMTKLNVHHLPVMAGERVLGILSTTDLARFQSSNSVYLVGDVNKAKDLDALSEISAKVGELQVHLINGGATADQVGQAISAITDAITLRLLEIAEAELGPPPVPYAWMVGGSQARREQSSHSDQDNALLIADHMKPEDDAYFAALANMVNDGLNACGYVYCPGDVMARNPKWRQPLRIWKKYFNTWIQRPEPMALMLSSVFFDLRPVHDPEGLFEEIHDQVLNLSKANRIFIAYMAANAVKNRPPLGFFRNFVLIQGGEHDHTFNIKHRGMVPIIDLTRVYALSSGITETNTLERLRAAAGINALSQEGAANLIDAAEFIGTLRMRHQAGQLRRGEQADNFLSPDEISALERGHLKDAFILINTMQDSIAQRYQTGRIN
jgi:CBS domain-containing protein